MLMETCDILSVTDTTAECVSLYPSFLPRDEIQSSARPLFLETIFVALLPQVLADPGLLVHPLFETGQGR